MQLSDRFELSDLTRSETAEKHGIDNTPSQHEVSNLRAMATHLLDPLFEQFDDLRITSGFRCEELNIAVGGSNTSSHVQGQAVDVEPTSSTKLVEIIEWATANLQFDRAILEYPPDGWVHFTFKEDGPFDNKIFLKLRGSGYERINVEDLSKWR